MAPAIGGPERTEETQGEGGGLTRRDGAGQGDGGAVPRRLVIVTRMGGSCEREYDWCTRAYESNTSSCTVVGEENGERDKEKRERDKRIFLIYAR